MSQLHARLLQRAADKLGGMEELARFLQVPETRLRIWMRGLISPPGDVFLKLVDLVEERPPGHNSSGDASKPKGAT